jgi:phosphatidylserine/phosphatidylglycerophosphate/cardiolipin synthase-like enzyme
MNLDNASLLYNFEANIVTTNAKFTEELSAHFVYDSHKSREVTAEQWRKRFFTEKILSFAVRFIVKFL